MKIASVLLAIILLLGITNAYIITTTYYTDAQCTVVDPDTEADVINGKSGECLTAAEFGFNGKVSVKDDAVEYCIYATDKCSGAAICYSEKTNTCNVEDDGGYSKTVVVGSASAVAISGLLIAAAIALVL